MTVAELIKGRQESKGEKEIAVWNGNNTIFTKISL